MVAWSRGEADLRLACGWCIFRQVQSQMRQCSLELDATNDAILSNRRDRSQPYQKPNAYLIQTSPATSSQAPYIVAMDLLQALARAPAKLERWSLKLGGPLQEMLRTNWHLGLTCFGGPAVHFQIVREVLARVDRL